MVSAWRASLDAGKLGSSSITNRIVGHPQAGRRGVEKGLLAAGVSLMKKASSRFAFARGTGLSLRQAQAFRAILAALIGWGLRRFEVATRMFTHIDQRDDRWCIVDRVGKHSRVPDRSGIGR